jgi:hypothetical protein
LQHPAQAKSFIMFQCQRIVCNTYVLLKYKRTALGGVRVASTPMIGMTFSIEVGVAFSRPIAGAAGCHIHTLVREALVEAPYQAIQARRTRH